MAADQVLVVRVGRTPLRVAHLDDPAQPRQPGGDLPDAVGEAGVDDHRFRIGVFQDLAQLLVAVPVVDVDVHGVELDRGEERLEVLAAVVEVERDLGTHTDAGSLQPRRQASGSLVQLAPGAHPAPVDQGDLVRDGVGDRLPDRSKVQFHIVPLQSTRSWPSDLGDGRTAASAPTSAASPPHAASSSGRSYVRAATSSPLCGVASSR